MAKTGKKVSDFRLLKLLMRCSGERMWEFTAYYQGLYQPCRGCTGTNIPCTEYPFQLWWSPYPAVFRLPETFSKQLLAFLWCLLLMFSRGIIGRTPAQNSMFSVAPWKNDPQHTQTSSHNIKPQDRRDLTSQVYQIFVFTHTQETCKEIQEDNACIWGKQVSLEAIPREA